MNLKSILLSIVALLNSPDLDEVNFKLVAVQYQYNNSMFKRTARYWTYVYAKGNQCELLMPLNFYIGL